MTTYQQILNGIKDMGFENLLTTSHEEAENNSRKRNIVLTEVADGLCDIYLTYKYQGQFGEFVCWVSDEFEGDPDLVDSVLNAVHEFYSYSDQELDEDLIPNERLIPGFSPLD